MSDVLIAGGGPAGAAAARLLALWGHDVRLLTVAAAGRDDRRVLAESLPPSCRKLFDVLGVSEQIDGAGFIRSTGNTVWWGDQSPRSEPFASGEHGWQVTTDALGALMVAAARTAGVTITEERISATDLDAAPESIVLDCTGRSGIVARARGWRLYDADLRTIALVAVWRRSGEWDLPDPTHTVIESYPDGWMWSVPVASGARYVAAMVDPRSTDLAPAAARQVYLAEIAKTRRFASLLEGASLEDGPSGWDASMYSSSSYADGRLLLVGDAGSFIDPLSSAGVKKALASAWLASVAAHTALVRPEMRQVAFEFFEAREREIYDYFRILTQRFLGDAATGHSHPFWSDRAGWFDTEFGFDAASDHGVAIAFERIRSAPKLALRRGDHVRVEARPAVDGREIVMERRIVGAKSAVRYVHDVDVIALVDMTPQFDDAGALFDAYVRRHPPVALPDFLTALATAVANGWLTWRD